MEKSIVNAKDCILTEIFVSYCLNKAMEKENIKFLFIFVDDFLAGVHNNYVNSIRDVISQHYNGIKLKLNVEDENGEVFYCNMAISRDLNNNNRIRIRWWKKPQSSNKILDFHSFHPIGMKKNVVKEYVRNALSVTSHCTKTDASNNSFLF